MVIVLSPPLVERQSYCDENRRRRSELSPNYVASEGGLTVQTKGTGQQLVDEALVGDSVLLNVSIDINPLDEFNEVLHFGERIDSQVDVGLGGSDL